MSSKRIAVVSVGRSEYGLLRPLMLAFKHTPQFELITIATGAHFEHAQGDTLSYYAEDGLSVDYALPLIPNTDVMTQHDAQYILNSMSMGLSGLSEIFQTAELDAVVLLGDRFETLMCATAALMHRIPIVHLQGGELSYGALDDAMRHAVTKMASLHFTAAQTYAKRVIQMGELPERVFNVGAIGLDNLAHLKLLDKSALSQALQVEFNEMLFLVTLHPETVHPEQSQKHVECLIKALSHFENASVLITKANVDEGGDVMNAAWEKACEQSAHWTLIPSLGTQYYLSALQVSDVVIGNSSSGIIEAPFFKTPTVNIGTRQAGRLRADSVVEVEFEVDAIFNAIKHVQTKVFESHILQANSPYGRGGVSNKILAVLSETNFTDLLYKPFYDNVT